MDTILVPRSTTAPVGGTPSRDLELLEWARGVVDSVLLGARASVTSSVSTNAVTVAVTL